jgi:hypothetical protein
MTVIIDDKDKIPYEEYTNPWITIQDIRICSIRQIPLPRIVNSIYRSSADSDSWLCRNCKLRGDKWYLMIHNCKALIKEKLNFTLSEIQQVEEDIRRRLKASEWTCPYCKQVTDRFFKKFHYRCLPEEKKRELQKEEPKLEPCPTCNKSLDPYYKNFHICPSTAVNKKSTIKQQVPTHGRVNRWNRFRQRRKSLLYGSGLGDFMSHKAVLKGEYWFLYIDGKRIGPVEKATPEELTSWDPKNDSNTDTDKQE